MIKSRTACFGIKSRGAGLQEEGTEGDDTVWNLNTAGGTCLGLVANTVGDALVPLILPFMQENATHADWRRREASLFAFGSMLVRGRDSAPSFPPPHSGGDSERNTVRGGGEGGGARHSEGDATGAAVRRRCSCSAPCWCEETLHPFSPPHRRGANQELLQPPCASWLFANHVGGVTAPPALAVLLYRRQAPARSSSGRSFLP